MKTVVQLDKMLGFGSNLENIFNIKFTHIDYIKYKKIDDEDVFTVPVREKLKTDEIEIPWKEKFTDKNDFLKQLKSIDFYLLKGKEIIIKNNKIIKEEVYSNIFNTNRLKMIYLDKERQKEIEEIYKIQHGIASDTFVLNFVFDNNIILRVNVLKNDWLSWRANSLR